MTLVHIFVSEAYLTLAIANSFRSLVLPQDPALSEAADQTGLAVCYRNVWVRGEVDGKFYHVTRPNR